MKSDLKRISGIVIAFLVIYFLPISETPGGVRFRNGIYEALALLNEYAREHVLLCLIPAFFIAGAISVFISQESVIRYFGVRAKKWLSFSVASVSGTILAVCSCTVLPLFAGIYSRGAGVGPACTFLYSGPAINVLALILTARVLGPDLGIARGIVAIMLSLIIGLTMGIIFRNDKNAIKSEDDNNLIQKPIRPLWKNAVYFASMIGILVFANWFKPSNDTANILTLIYRFKWLITIGFSLVLVGILYFWFTRNELSEWIKSTWLYIWMILPLLFFGVLAAGFLLGRPGHEAIIPVSWIEGLVGGNSLGAVLFASVAGSLMYFATLTEVPIIQGLMGAGMGKGPALALLLAGPALSLPNMIIIRQVLGNKKTLVFIILVVILSTIAGVIYGNI